jgi:predicted nucleic acid-binding Zn ribbon protein
MQHFDSDDDEIDEKEPHWLDDDVLDEETEESEPTISCPYCHQEIYEDAQRCPHCERYIAEEDLRRNKSWLIVIGTVVCLYIVYRWIAG